MLTAQNQKKERREILLSRLAVGFPHRVVIAVLFCTCKCVRKEGRYACVLRVFLALIPVFVCEPAVIYKHHQHCVTLLLWVCVER